MQGRTKGIVCKTIVFFWCKHSFLTLLLQYNVHSVIDPRNRLSRYKIVEPADLAVPVFEVGHFIAFCLVIRVNFFLVN